MDIISQNLLPVLSVTLGERQTKQMSVCLFRNRFLVYEVSAIDAPLTVSVFQIQCEKVDSPERVIQIQHQEKPHWKQYLELRKQFGLCKEERVYLRRIPLRTSCEQPGAGAGPGNGLKRKNDSCNSSSLDVEVTDQHQECVEEEKVS